MAATQTMIDKLDAAMARGLLRIHDGTSMLIYQSVEDMQKARAGLVALLKSQETPTRAAPRYQVADFSDDR